MQKGTWGILETLKRNMASGQAMLSVLKMLGLIGKMRNFLGE
jgi:hypothetical protein